MPGSKIIELAAIQYLLVQISIFPFGFFFDLRPDVCMNTVLRTLTILRNKNRPYSLPKAILSAILPA
jgi:hypothetical protein